MSNPPGHVPGVHFPRTYHPIAAAAVAAHQQSLQPPPTEDQKRDAAAKDRRELELSRAAIAKEEESLASVAPGFPVKPITAPALAKVLQQLVPERAVSIVVGQKMFGRKRHAKGWGLSLGVRKPRNFPLEQREALVVTCDGHAFRLQTHTSYGPDFWLDTPYMAPEVATVSVGDLRRLRRQVLIWMGHRNTYTASMMDHYRVDVEGRQHFPLREDWEAEFGWD